MEMARSVPTHVAAQLMGKSEDWVRWGLRQKRIPIGDAVPSMRAEQRWGYYISPKLLSDYTGVPVEDINRMAEEHRRKVKEARRNA
jgi:hypothetical protein